MDPGLFLENRIKIIAAIRSGTYSHVAAEAFGMPGEDFERWMELGEGKRKREPFASFAREVREAEAQARLRAETTAFQKEPKIWLKNGPGRERPGKPGWSATVKPVQKISESINPLLSPEITDAFQALLQSLLPFPEARKAVADYLWTLGLKTPSEKSHGRKSKRKTSGTPGTQTPSGPAGHGPMPAVPTTAGGEDGEDGADVSVPVPEGGG